MKTVTTILILILGVASLRADDVSVKLLAPTTRNSPGAQIAVDLLWLNSGGSPQHLSPPAKLDAVLRQGTASWPVRLRQVGGGTDTSEVTLAPGAFARRGYVLTVPPDAGGSMVLAIDQPVPAEAILEIAAAESPALAAAPAPESPTGTAAPALRPVASRLHRTVMENFGFHEPIYFLYGPDEPVAKFQFSFRYRLAGRSDSPLESDPAPKGLYLAYTQRSLWNIKEPSSPFYDTSYMPELMFESLAAETPDRDGLVNFIGYQAGYRHESNGRDGLDSRSLDIVYLRTGVLIGRSDGWRAIIVPRVFAYLKESSDNADIEDYRGYGELLVGFGRDDGIQVNVTGIAGRDWDKGSVQVDLTHPIKIPSVHFDTFLHVQYFNGYGESLRDYNRKESTWRAGISLVR